jgi:hypothetical protein
LAALVRDAVNITFTSLRDGTGAAASTRFSGSQRPPAERGYCIEHGVEIDRAALDVLGVDQTAQANVPLVSADAVHAVAKLSEKPRLLDSQF